MNPTTLRERTEVEALKAQLLESKAQLKKLREEHHMLLDGIDEMLWSIDVASAKMLNISSACERIFGYTADEMYHINDIWTEFVLPADHKMLEQSLGDLSMGISVKKQYRIIHRDGTIRWLESKMIPTLDERGQLMRFNGVTRDITKEKKVNKALMESESRFRQFFNHAHEAILVMDILTGCICDCNSNALKLFKYTGTEMLAKTPLSLSPQYQPDGSESAPQVVVKIQATLRGDAPVFEWTHTDANGCNIPCEVRLNLISANERTFVRASIIDISARKRAEAELQALNESLEIKVQERTAELTEANCQLEAFSSAVSHDLQAPLRIVTGFAKMLACQYSDRIDDDGREMLKTVLSNTVRMSSLVRDLLAFARLGKAENQKMAVNMDEAVKDVINSLRSHLPDCRADIRVGNIRDANCDPAMIRQVWANLISNAVKYSSKKEIPQIEIGSDLVGDEVVYHVKDNGAGFDMQCAAKLFSAFTRLHSADEFEGSGIGLAMVHSIITRHGGRVWAEGVPDEGATFYFSLPVG